MTTKSKPKKATPRKAREPNHEEIAAKLERLLSSDQLTEGQYEILTDLLLELSSDSGIDFLHPALIRSFYMLASEKRAEEVHRTELRDSLQAIEQGEAFPDYRITDGLERYRWRQHAARLSTDPSVSRYMRRKLREEPEAEYTHIYRLPDLIKRAEASRKKGGAR
jgi:hypothetical protein